MPIAQGVLGGQTSGDVRGKTGGWRRRRDSNPGYGFRPYNGLANRRLQPLGHVSVSQSRMECGVSRQPPIRTKRTKREQSGLESAQKPAQSPAHEIVCSDPVPKQATLQPSDSARYHPGLRHPLDSEEAARALGARPVKVNKEGSAMTTAEEQVPRSADSSTRLSSPMTCAGVPGLDSTEYVQSDRMTAESGFRS
jgi:hypothetical protein